MIDRLRGVRLPQVALAGGVLFAVIPLSPAMGLIGLPADAQTVDVAAADATTVQLSAAALSPVAMMESASRERQMLSAREARQRAEALAAQRRQSNALIDQQQTEATRLSTPQVSTGGPIPTTDVTDKTRQIQGLIRKYFPADQLGNAMAVSACESGHADVKGAVNSDRTIDWGVFQLNDGGTLQQSLHSIGVSYSSKAEAQQKALDTRTNIKAAASIYAARGWAPWVCAYKIGVVGGLYANTPGPMDGKFDDWGRPTVDVPVITVDPGTTTPDPGNGGSDPANGGNKGGKGGGKGGTGTGGGKDNTGTGNEPSPTPTKTPKPTSTPTPSPTVSKPVTPTPTPAPTKTVPERE